MLGNEVKDMAKCESKGNKLGKKRGDDEGKERERSSQVYCTRMKVKLK